MAQIPESLENLLARLFDLMEKSDSIRNLPTERKEKIKAKYGLAGIDAVRNGILMLEKDIAEKNAVREKARLGLTRSTEKLRELKIVDAEERRKSEKLAEEILKAAGAAPEKKRFPLLLLLAAAIAGGALVYYFFFSS